MIIRRGTSIIEIIIAAALISVAMIAALSLMNHSQKQNAYARDLEEATKYAAQAAEWIRTERDTLGWATIASKVNKDATNAGSSNSVYCLSALPSSNSPDLLDFTYLIEGTCGYTDYIPTTTPSFFKRQMSINTSDPQKLSITITVTWPWQSETVHQAVLEMELSQWL